MQMGQLQPTKLLRFKAVSVSAVTAIWLATASGAFAQRIFFENVDFAKAGSHTSNTAVLTPERPSCSVDTGGSGRKHDLSASAVTQVLKIEANSRDGIFSSNTGSADGLQAELGPDPKTCVLSLLGGFALLFLRQRRR